MFLGSPYFHPACKCRNRAEGTSKAAMKGPARIAHLLRTERVTQCNSTYFSTTLWRLNSYPHFSKIEIGRELINSSFPYFPLVPRTGSGCPCFEHFWTLSIILDRSAYLYVGTLCTIIVINAFSVIIGTLHTWPDNSDTHMAENVPRY